MVQTLITLTVCISSGRKTLPVCTPHGKPTFLAVLSNYHQHLVKMLSKASLTKYWHCLSQDMEHQHLKASPVSQPKDSRKSQFSWLLFWTRTKQTAIFLLTLTLWSCNRFTKTWTPTNKNSDSQLDKLRTRWTTKSTGLLKQTWNGSFSLRAPERVAFLDKRSNGNLRTWLKLTRTLTAAKSELNSNTFQRKTFKTGSAHALKVFNSTEWMTKRSYIFTTDLTGLTSLVIS